MTLELKLLVWSTALALLQMPIETPENFQAMKRKGG